MAFAAIPATLTIEDQTMVRTGLAGEVMPGGAVIRKASTGKLFISDSEVATEDDVEGVALVAAAAADQWITYAPIGAVIVTSGLTAGQTYYLGGAADQGEIGLFADAVTGTHFATIVGIALSTTRLKIVGIKTDVQL